MDIQKVREAFDKGSIIITDGKLSVFYHRDASGWGEQTWSDVTPDGDCCDKKQILLQLIRNSDRFEIHFFGNGSFRLDFLVFQELPGGVNQCWFMPLRRDKTPEENQQEELEWIRSNPPGLAEFRDFMLSYDIHNPAELQNALQAWDDLHPSSDDDTPVSEESLDRWDLVLQSARAFYTAVAIGSLSVNRPETGQDFGWVEFQSETSDQIGISLAGHKKDLFLNLAEASKIVSIEAGNNDGEKLTYINMVFYS